jgi:hypothetical protein
MSEAQEHIWAAFATGYDTPGNVQVLIENGEPAKCRPLGFRPQVEEDDCEPTGTGWPDGIC